VNRLAAIVWLLVLIALGGWLPGHVRFDNGVQALLPRDADAELSTLVGDALSTEGARQLVVTVLAEPEQVEQLAEVLAGLPEVASARAGPPEGMEEAIWSVYRDHRYAFWSWSPPDTTQAGLDGAAQGLLDRLSSPMSGIVKRLAPEDPWLITLERVQALETLGGGSLRVRDGQFWTDDGWAVLFVETASSPFDAQATRRIVDAARAAVPGTPVEFGGVHRFAEASETLAKGDARRVGVFSLIGITVLLLGTFRRLRVLPLAFWPVVSGVLVGLSATLAWFGAIHGLTLAFGATLIGVAIDYPIHLFHHAWTAREEGPVAFRALRPALVLGGLTTIAGFSGLLVTAVPAIQQLAVFSVAGVVGAWLSTALHLPRFIHPPDAPTALDRISRRLTAGYLGRTAAAGYRRGAVGVALVVALVGAVQLQWADGVASLDLPDPAIAAEDARVRARAGRFDTQRVVVVEGDSWDERLERSRAVAERLRGSEALGAAIGLHDAIWPVAVQQRNLAAAAEPGLPERMERALGDAGFRGEMFREGLQQLSSDTSPLTVDAALDGPLGDLFRGFVLPSATPRLLVLLRDVREPAAIDAALGDLPGVRFLDRQATLARAFSAFRDATAWRSLGGLAAVLLVIGLWYRAVRPTLAVFLPIALACAATVGTLALLGQALTVVHLVSLLLVLGIVADYAIFLAAAARRPGQDDTPAAIAMAALSTLLAFGLLAGSAFPALRAVGSTVGLGVVWGWLLAPLARPSSAVLNGPL